MVQLVSQDFPSQVVVVRSMRFFYYHMCSFYFRVAADINFTVGSTVSYAVRQPL